MLAQLEVKEINSKTFKKGLLLIFKDFPMLEFFSNSRTFQDFQGPWTPAYIWHGSKQKYDTVCIAKILYAEVRFQGHYLLHKMINSK